MCNVLQSEVLINKSNQVIKSVENCMSENNIAAVHDIDDDDIDEVVSVTELLDKYADIFEECDVNIDNESVFSNYNENAIAYFAGYVA